MPAAPVLVSVYDRPHHFRACIESLARNPDASETSLYIASDGPRDDASRPRVEAVRAYISQITGFKRVIAHCPRENTARHLMHKLLDEVRSDHRHYIKTEDDNVFSPHALAYFNEALEVHAEDERVHAVCGHMAPGFPARAYEQVYLRSAVSPWGIALWRDRDLPADLDQVALARAAFSDRGWFSTFNQTLPDLAPLVRSVARGHLKALDVVRCLNAAQRDLICVFPSVSLVRNIGHDGSGMNCTIDDRLQHQAIAEHPIVIRRDKPVRADPEHQAWLNRVHGGRRLQHLNWLLFAEANSRVPKVWRALWLLSRPRP